MADYKHNPKEYIINAFNKHLNHMTKDDWEPIFSHWLSTNDTDAERIAGFASMAAREAIGNLGWFYAADKARDIAEHAVVKGDTDIAGPGVVRYAMYAVDEISASDLIRKHGRSFFFLPMFGFADEQALVNK